MTSLGVLGRLRRIGEDFDPRYDKRVLEQEKLKNLELGIAGGDVDAPTVKLSEFEGMPVITSMSDRTAAGGVLEQINDVVLNNPVRLRGGQDFMMENPWVWASAESPSNSILNLAKQIKSDTGQDPLFAPWRMAPTGGDFATMTGETMLAYASSAMSKAEKKDLDKAIRQYRTKGVWNKKKQKYVGANKKIVGWKGVDNPASFEAWRKAPDVVRKELKNVLDKQFRNRGGLGIGEARLAVSDPRQLIARDGGIQNIGRIFSDKDVSQSDHPSYPFAVPGEGIGTIDQDVGAVELMPDIRLGEAQEKVKDPLNPTQENLRAMQMGPKAGVITEDILKSLSDRGVDVGSIDPKLLAAITAGGVGAAALMPREAEAAPFGTLARSLGIPTRKAFHGSPHDHPPATRIRDKTTGKTYLIDDARLNKHPVLNRNPENFEVIERYPEGAFDMTKVGTGEGAQAYGHGLYFSSEKDIAKYYRDQLSDPAEFGRIDGEPVYDVYKKYDKQSARLPVGKELDATYEKMAFLEDLSFTRDFDESLEKLDDPDIEAWANSEIKPKYKAPGFLYEVEIPDESNMIDFDKPLNEQPQAAKTAFSKYITTYDADDPEVALRDFMDTDYAKLFPSARDVEWARRILEDPDYDLAEDGKAWLESQMRAETGSSFYNLLGSNKAGSAYQRMASDLGGAQAASDALRKEGVLGITYKGNESGEQNFVVFDDRMINTVEKGQVDPKLLPAIAAGGAAGEFARRRSQKKTFSDQLKNTGQEMSVLAAALGAGVMSELAKGAVMFNNIMPSRGMDMGTALEQANQAGDLVNEGMMGALPNFLQPEETPILGAISSGMEEIADRTTSSLDWLQRTGVLSEDARRVLEAAASEL